MIWYINDKYVLWDWVRPNQGTLLDQNDEEKADGKTHDTSTDPAEWCSIAKLCRTSKLKKLRFRSREATFQLFCTCRCWTTDPGSSVFCTLQPGDSAWWGFGQHCLMIPPDPGWSDWEGKTILGWPVVLQLGSGLKANWPCPSMLSGCSLL